MSSSLLRFYSFFYTSIILFLVDQLSKSYIAKIFSFPISMDGSVFSNKDGMQRISIIDWNFGSNKIEESLDVHTPLFSLSRTDNPHLAFGINIGDNFDIIINATSVGLKNEDEINLDFSRIEKGKLFYDVIYNPSETKFLKDGKKLKNKTENGKKMFIYQASAAFKIWHGIEPTINEEVIKLLEND